MGKIADRFANKRNKMAKSELLGFYWGYNAKDHGEGFEFNNLVLTENGMSNKEASMVGKCFYDACKIQIKQLMVNDFREFDGNTLEEVLDSEQKRLDFVVAEMKKHNYRMPLEDLLRLAIVACCAISTLVAFGRLKQDEYNGDSFMMGKS